MEHNFRKQSSSNIDSMNVPYDYRSIMHYGGTAFGSGKITIQTKDRAMQTVIGNRRGFSDFDIKQMNLLYKCSGTRATICTLQILLPFECSWIVLNSILMCLLQEGSLRGI